MARAAKKSGKKKSSAKKATAKKRSIRGRAAKKASDSEASVETAVEKPEATAAVKVLEPFADLEHAFERFLQRRMPHPFRWAQTPWNDFSEMIDIRVPSVDVVDRKKEIVVRAEVPGIERDDLDVSVTDRTLTIKGMSRQEETEEKDSFFRHEIKSGKVSRSVLLPADVDANRAKASFRNGVLKLHLPKLRASKRHKISMG